MQPERELRQGLAYCLRLRAGVWVEAGRSSGTKEVGLRARGGEADKKSAIRKGVRKDWVWVLAERVGRGKVWARMANWSGRT